MGGGSTVTSDRWNRFGARFDRYKRAKPTPCAYGEISEIQPTNTPPHVLIINQKVYGGILRQAKSILMNYSESAKIRLYGAAITSICHLLGVSLYGANYLSPRNSQWQCVNTLGLRSMQMQKSFSTLRKVPQKNHVHIHAKSPWLSILGYCRTTPKRATESLIPTSEVEAAQSRLTISGLISQA